MNILLVYLEPLDNEPLGLLYIGTVLQKAGYRVKIVGISRFNPWKRFLKEVLHFKPSVVGLTVTTALADKAQAVAKLVKDNFPKITVIAGGPHPTILPFETLHEGSIDICVIGEGEVTVIDLLTALSSSMPPEEVKGIAYLKEGKLVITEDRGFIQDLDAIPFPDRGLMPKDVIYGRAAYPAGNPCMLLVTVRGCPYQCAFCQPAVAKIFGKRVRRRSPENTVEEIIELKRKYGINGLWINDDTFLLDDHWTARFCDLMLQANLDISWYTNGRLDNVNKDILIKLLRAGCVGLVLTPETGSQRIRNEVLNKNVSDEAILKAYKICHEIGLPVQANIMLASPTETDSDLDSSISLIKKIQPHFMNFSYTTALPGTHIYEKYLRLISASAYYKNYRDYDIGRLKKIDCQISDARLRSAWRYFEKRYSNISFSNRARHFFRYPYFRRIIYKRWKTLIFNRHPNFKHLIFDIAAIIFGSIIYLKNIKSYRGEFE